MPKLARQPIHTVTPDNNSTPPLDSTTCAPVITRSGSGRFLSQDVYPHNFSNPIELNRYAYAANSPINFSDPTGNAALVEYAPLIGAVAFAGGNAAYQLFMKGSINVWEVLGWAILGSGVGYLASIIIPVIMTGASVQAVIAWTQVTTMLLGWFGTEGYGGVNLGFLGQASAFLWGIQGIKHNLDVLSNSEDGNKWLALAGLMLTSWANYIGAKAVLSIPTVWSLKNQLAAAPDKLVFLQNYASQVLGKPTSVQFWSKGGGYFDDATMTIFLSENAGNLRLASFFLHELTHAQQLMAGGTINGLRLASAWLMPMDGIASAGPQWLWNALLPVRLPLYVINPAESLAYASGAGDVYNLGGVLIQKGLAILAELWAGGD